MPTTEAEIIVLGMGPGNEQASADLLNAGLSLIAIEAELIGGECPYWGCVPTKMAVRAGQVLQESRRVDALAGHATATPDWAPVAKRIRKDATGDWNDESGVKRITDKGGAFVRGKGTITGPRTVEVDGQTYTATKALIIGTGTRTAIPPIEGLSQVDYWTNRKAVKTEFVPDSIIILGGGAIGCEFAQIFGRFGSDVTIVEAADSLIPAEEPEAGKELQKALEAEGITVKVGIAAKSVSGTSPTTVELSDGTSVTADVVLVAAGRTAELDELGADSIGAGPATGNKFLPTDDYMRVLGNGEVLDGVYALGDVAGKGAFTHVAIAHARMIADQILGRETTPFSKRAVGHVTFTDPEVGVVGLTERQARDKGINVVTAVYPMEKVARAWMHGAGNGGVLKLVIDKDKRTVVGATAMGPHGGEVLSGFIVAVASEISVDKLRETVWAYPTYHRGYDAVLDELPEELKTRR